MTPGLAEAELAREAVRYAFPLYEMARTRAATTPRRDADGRFAGDAPECAHRWINTFIHTRGLVGPRHRQVVSPNNDTLYSMAWLDLADGPLRLDVPDSGGRYYVVGLLDFYTNPFRCLGTRTTGNGPCAFLLHGPAWRGEIPAGVTPVRCPTNVVWVGVRVLVEGEGDLAGAHALQDGLRLGRPDGSAAALPCDMGMQLRERPGDPHVFASVVNRALRENPPPADEAGLLDRFAPLGIGAGAAGSDSLDAAQAALLGEAIADVLAELAAARPSAVGEGWFLPVDILDSFGNRYAERAHVAYNYIGAMGVEEAMYVVAECDGDGVLLDGRADYELVFPPGGLPQVGAFWSLTMYRKADCLLVDNPLNRYSIGDRTQSLRHEPDGSLRLWLSPRPPADPAYRANWLPAPDEGFYLVLRLYVPGAAHLNKTFAYPPVRRIAIS